MAIKYPRSCIILGAGASKGANLPNTPPLDSDFLDVASQLFEGSGKFIGLKKEARDEWKRFVTKIARIGIGKKELRKWKLETLTTFLEARKNVNFQNTSGRPDRHAETLASLNRIVCYVLYFRDGTNSCSIHEKMFKFIKPTSVISFNYDLIADQSLFKTSMLDHRCPEYSSGKTMRLWINSNWNDRKWFQRRRPNKKDGHISLYKLHGSIHWQSLTRGGGYIISGIKRFPPQEQGFEYNKIPRNPMIVPPVAAKMSISDTHLLSVWEKAHKELKKSSTWFLWGYSFPQTDTITSVLLKTCIKDSRGKQKTVIVINPDYSVSDRVKSLLEKVRVKQYSSAPDFLLRENQIELMSSNTQSTNV